VDTSSFFQYPIGAPPPPAGDPPAPAGAGPTRFLADRTQEEWAQLLEHATTVRFGAGDLVLTEGADDRAFYVLVAGRVEVVGAEDDVIQAPAELGDAAFFDGLPRAVSVRALAPGEALRLSWEAFEALAVRQPRLAQALLVDLGRVAAARQRASRGVLPAFTG